MPNPKSQTKRITLPVELCEKIERLAGNTPGYNTGWHLLNLLKNIPEVEYICTGDIQSAKYITDHDGNVLPINNWLSYEQLVTLIRALSSIASNFGMGSFTGSPAYAIEQTFRIAASKALHEAGLKYIETNYAPGDGWYLKGNKISD